MQPAEKKSTRSFPMWIWIVGVALLIVIVYAFWQLSTPEPDEVLPQDNITAVPASPPSSGSPYVRGNFNNIKALPAEDGSVGMLCSEKLIQGINMLDLGTLTSQQVYEKLGTMSKMYIPCSITEAGEVRGLDSTSVMPVVRYVKALPDQPTDQQLMGVISQIQNAFEPVLNSEGIRGFNEHLSALGRELSNTPASEDHSTFVLEQYRLISELLPMLSNEDNKPVTDGR